MSNGTIRETEAVVFATGKEIYWYNPLIRKCQLLVSRPHRVDCLEVGEYRRGQHVPYIADAWTFYDQLKNKTSSELNITLARGSAYSAMKLNEEIWSICYDSLQVWMDANPETPHDTLMLVCGRRGDLAYRIASHNRSHDFPGKCNHEPCVVISHGTGHGPGQRDIFWLSGSGLYQDLKQVQTVHAYKGEALLVPVGEDKEAVHVMHYSTLPARYPDGARLSHGSDTFLRFPTQKLGTPCLAVIYRLNGNFRLFFGTRGYYQDEPWFSLYDEPISPYIENAEPVLRLASSSVDDNCFPPKWGNPCRAIGLEKLEQMLG